MKLSRSKMCQVQIAVENCFRASFNMFTDKKRNLLMQNRAILFAYKRVWKFKEIWDNQIGYI